MNATSNGIRRFHRWTSIVFTLTVIANFAAMTRGTPPAWITYSPLPPLALLLFSGLYLFARPYLSRERRLTERACGTQASQRQRAHIDNPRIHSSAA